MRGSSALFWAVGLSSLVLSRSSDFFGGRNHFGRSAFGGSRDNEFYDALNVPRDASPEEVKRAYRELAKKHHPDKGGDPERFKEIGEAYGVLSDPRKRELYDQVGKAGMEGSGPVPDADGFSTADLLSQLFGMGGPRPPSDMVFELQVPLEDLYAGRTLPLNLKGPGQEDRTLEVTIPAGAVDGQRIVLPGEAHDGRADIVLVLRQKKHRVFTRRNGDLLVKVEVSLAAALTGWEVEVETLDKRKINVVGQPGDIVNDGAVRAVPGEGMPIVGRDKRGEDEERGPRHGKLFVLFSVRYPRRLRLGPGEREQLKAILEGRPTRPLHGRGKQPQNSSEPDTSEAEEADEASPAEGVESCVGLHATLSSFGTSGATESQKAANGFEGPSGFTGRPGGFPGVFEFFGQNAGGGAFHFNF